MTRSMLAMVVIVGAMSLETAAAVTPNSAEMTLSGEWGKARFTDVKAGQGSPVFSFVYGGKPWAELWKTWAVEHASRPLNPQRSEHTLTYTDPRTSLVVRCVAVTYADYPVVEWTVYLKNAGRQDTPLLENVRAIDEEFTREAKGEFVLHHWKGDGVGPTLYQPLDETLLPKSVHRFAPAGGRGSNIAFPYYNLQMSGGGMMLAVGWPGQWAASFTRDEKQGLRIVAGQELTHLVLRPGEEIRTPLVALLFWRGGDLARSQNLWRRWMIAHNLPRTADGKLPQPILHGNTSLEFNEMCDANEENQRYFIDRYAREHIALDSWWMDAGWYPNKNGWPNTGTWEVDTKRFPRGLRAISDHARTKGVKTLVWFEPERVTAGTWLAENHPEWILGGPRGGLLNLGNTDCRDWLIRHIDKTIVEQGIDFYRQDFNMDPLGHWRRNDPPDRQGITENLHIQGYLAFWDAIRRRHPDVLIDSCASGGRRNDLETMRRAVPLHPTDYNYADLAAKQAFHLSLFQWIPYYGSNTLPVGTVDTYAIRSGYAMSVVLGYDLRRQDIDCGLLRRLTDQWRMLAPCYYGDFHPLLPYSLDDAVWMAWQFDCPERGEGVIQVFRREKSPYESARLVLYGLEPKAVYTLVNLDVAGTVEMAGDELMHRGLPIVINKRPEAVVITYKKKG